MLRITSPRRARSSPLVDWQGLKLVELLWLAPAFAALLFWPRTFPLDDAWITLHNARSLLEASDGVFGGSPLVGATSAVHLICVSAFGLFVPLPTASLAVSAICSCLYAWGLWRLQPYWPFVAVGLLSGCIPMHLLNGLETSMALAAVVWAFVLADSKWLPLLLGLLPFIRPEFVFLSAALGLRRMRTDPVWTASLALFAALPFALWYYLSTGAPFPNTVGAKVIFFGAASEPAATKLSEVGAALVYSYVIVLSPGLIGLRRVRAGWCGMVYLAGVLTIAYLTLPGSLIMNYARYLAPFVPVLCYGFTALPRPATYVAALIAALSGTAALLALKQELAGAQRWFDAANYVATLPTGSTVLVHDVGVIAWTKPKARLIDVVGLKTPSSAQIMGKYKVVGCHWGPALSEIALRTNARYAVILQNPFWKCIGTNLQEQGWKLKPIHPGELTVFALSPPGQSQQTWSNVPGAAPAEHKDPI